MLIVGIDPPNGIATMDGNGRLLSVKTSDFWDIAATLSIIAENNKQDRLSAIVYIEAPQVHKSLYARHNGKNNRIQKRIAQNVGANKQTSQLLIERCQRLGIPCIPLPPRKHNTTKKNPAEFGRVTGWESKTSSHGRDAAGLILSRNWRHDLATLSQKKGS